MKGALVKELYLFKHYYAVFGVVFAVVFVAAYFTVPGAVVITLCVAVFNLSKYVSVDEISGWNTYSRALPYSPLKAFAAKYILAISEFTVLCALVSAVRLFSPNSYLSNAELVWLFVINFTVSCVTVSVLFPLALRDSKRSKRFRVIVQFTAVLVYLETNALLNLSLLGGLLPLLYLERWLIAVIIGSDIALLILSLLFCTVTNIGNLKGIYRPIRKAAFTIVAAVVAVNGVSAGALAAKSRFTSHETWAGVAAEIHTKGITNSGLINRADLKMLTENMSDVTLCDKSLEEITAFFTNLGLRNYDEKDIFLKGTAVAYLLTDFGGISVEVMEDYDSVDSLSSYEINIWTGLGPFYTSIKEETAYKNMVKSFVNMTEVELFENIFKNGLDVYLIYEEKNDSGCVERIYSVSFWFYDVTQTEQRGCFDVDFTVRDGRVVSCEIT